MTGACQKSCNFCECIDDDEHTIKLQDVEKPKTCEWATQRNDPDVNDARLDRYCYGDDAKTIASEEVGNFCVHSCGFCEGNYRAPGQVILT